MLKHFQRRTNQDQRMHPMIFSNCRKSSQIKAKRFKTLPKLANTALDESLAALLDPKSWKSWEVESWINFQTRCKSSRRNQNRRNSYSASSLNAWKHREYTNRNSSLEPTSKAAVKDLKALSQSTLVSLSNLQHLLTRKATQMRLFLSQFWTHRMPPKDTSKLKTNWELVDWSYRKKEKP